MAASMLFMPTVDGSLHIGNAIVLWLTAKEAMVRGLKLRIKYDDLWNVTNGASADWPERERRAITSIHTALERLDITATFSRHTHRLDGYHAMIDKMLACNLAEESWLRDDCRNWNFGKRVPGQHLRAVMDFLDWDVPVHIRGADLMALEEKEMGLMRLMKKQWPQLDRPPMEYKYIPVIATEDGVQIHKSNRAETVSDMDIEKAWRIDYMFQNWLAGSSPRELRNALEAIVPEALARPEYAQIDIIPGGDVIRRHEFEKEVQHAR